MYYGFVHGESLSKKGKQKAVIVQFYVQWKLRSQQENLLLRLHNIYLYVRSTQKQQ